jgi:hypothetical protein
MILSISARHRRDHIPLQSSWRTARGAAIQRDIVTLIVWAIKLLRRE